MIDFHLWFIWPTDVRFTWRHIVFLFCEVRGIFYLKRSCTPISHLPLKLLSWQQKRFVLLDILGRTDCLCSFKNSPLSCSTKICNEVCCMAVCFSFIVLRRMGFVAAAQLWMGYWDFCVNQELYHLWCYCSHGKRTAKLDVTDNFHGDVVYFTSTALI